MRDAGAEAFVRMVQLLGVRHGAIEAGGSFRHRRPDATRGEGTGERMGRVTSQRGRSSSARAAHVKTPPD